MAPEMLLQRYQPRRVRVGYSIAVDYYSLGVTLFKLLTGARPFNRDQIRSFAEIRDCTDGNIGYKKYQVNGVPQHCIHSRELQCVYTRMLVFVLTCLSCEVVLM
jgi:serine/threonine protein kinase